MTNEDYEAFVVKAMEIFEKTFVKAALACLRAATMLENAGNELRQMRMHLLGHHAPTMQQWVNRFIEYVDGPLLYLAYTKFTWLVENGLEPEHAFHLVIGRDE